MKWNEMKWIYKIQIRYINQAIKSKINKIFNTSDAKSIFLPWFNLIYNYFICLFILDYF